MHSATVAPMDRPRIVISMTTSPRRMELFKPVVHSILNQSLKAAAIFLHLPARYRGRDEYQIPGWLSELKNIRINRATEQDWGPIMKLLPLLPMETARETILLTIDDDVILPPAAVASFVEASVAHPDTAFCSMGFRFEARTGHILPIRGQLSPCDALQGFSVCCYRRAHFDEKALISSIETLPEEFRINDDIILSNHVAANGIKRATILFPSGSLKFTDWSDNDPAALKSVGPGTHARYRQMREHLQREGRWHLG